MKITIATLANLRPDFIEIQLDSIKKFVTDQEVEFIVFNNASQDKVRYSEIEDICSKLSIKSVRVKAKQDNDASKTVARSLNNIWQNHLQYVKDILIIIDSDMFFIKEVNIEQLMQKHDFAFVPAYRGKNFEVLYPWTGLMFFNMNTLPRVNTLIWDTGKVLGYGVDVGGLNHYYLDKYKSILDILYLEMWNLEDIEENQDGTRTLKFSLNGNIRFITTLSGKNKLLALETKDPFISEKRSFPYQNEKDDYYTYLVDKFISFENFLKEKKVDLPKPFWIDIFSTESSDFKEGFIFHYKSWSNWLPFYTEEYNKQKTKNLIKIVNYTKKPTQVIPSTVDVVIPVYNGAPFIIDAIESVVHQTLPPARIIVIDDGSTDSTNELVSKYKETCPVEIVLVKKQNGGLSSARNAGIKESTSEFIAFLDADDTWEKNKLEEQARVWRDSELQNLGLVYCDYDIIDRIGNKDTKSHKVPLDRKVYGMALKAILGANRVLSSGSGVLIKRSVFSDVGVFDETLRFGEDWDMWLRIAQKYELSYSDKVLVHIRRHGENMTASQRNVFVGELAFYKKWVPLLKKDGYKMPIRWRIKVLYRLMQQLPKTDLMREALPILFVPFT